MGRMDGYRQNWRTGTAASELVRIDRKTKPKCGLYLITWTPCTLRSRIQGEPQSAGNCPKVGLCEKKQPETRNEPTIFFRINKPSQRLVAQPRGSRPNVVAGRNRCRESNVVN